jgi:anaerobic magnesium-protoporphyrin IX monomethyl ester cyclase
MINRKNSFIRNAMYYKKLQRYVHKEFRKAQGFHGLKNFSFSLDKIKKVAKLGYYVPSAFLDTLVLKKLAKNA